MPAWLPAPSHVNVRMYPSWNQNVNMLYSFHPAPPHHSSRPGATQPPPPRWRHSPLTARFASRRRHRAAAASRRGASLAIRPFAAPVVSPATARPPLAQRSSTGTPLSPASEEAKRPKPRHWRRLTVWPAFSKLVPALVHFSERDSVITVPNVKVLCVLSVR